MECGLYLSTRKSPILTYSTCVWRLRWGWLRLSFAEIFDVRKLESFGYRAGLFCVILHLAVSVEQRLVTGRDTTTAYTLCMFYLFILFIVYVLCMTSCLHVIGANDCKPQGPRHTRNVILARWFTIVRQVATPCCSNRGRSQLSPAVLSCL